MTQDLNKIYTYHPPKGDQPQRYTAIREKCRELAELVSELCPPSRERSLAFTKIEEASMWANASIARNELPDHQTCDNCKHEYEYSPTGMGPCFTCTVVAKNHWEAKDNG